MKTFGEMKIAGYRRLFDVEVELRPLTVMIGANGAGKTSLLARGLHQAREAGACVVLTDFQMLNAVHLESVEALLLTLDELGDSDLRDLLRSRSSHSLYLSQFGPNLTGLGAGPLIVAI